MWKEIEGYGGRYLINDDGDVYSTLRKKLLKPKTDKYGYLIVALSKDGKTSHIGVHHLVAMTFIKNPFNKPCVNHINEIKTDNRVTNLEWVTVKENDNHGTRNVRMSETKKRKPVLQINSDLNIVTKFKGVKDAQRATGVNRNCIREVCRGNRKTAGGFIWKYEEDK